MKENDFDQRFIDTYIKNKHLLDAKEVVAFEQQLESDKALADDIKLQQDIAKGIHLHFETELKNKLKKASEAPSNQTKIFSLQRGLLAAASISAILVVFSYFFSPKSTSSEIYSTYYTTYPNIVEPTERGENTTQKIDAYQLYEKKEYEKAVLAFDELLNKDGNNVPALFYKGLASIESEGLEIAIINLKRVAETDDTRFSLPASWYLALTYLKLDNKEEAKSILEKLATAESSYASKAEKVLEEL